MIPFFARFDADFLQYGAVEVTASETQDIEEVKYRTLHLAPWPWKIVTESNWCWFAQCSFLIYVLHLGADMNCPIWADLMGDFAGDTVN